MRAIVILSLASLVNCDFVVRLTTDVPGDVVINVTSSWAPLGAAHFKKLVDDGFFGAPAAFFRVVPNFVVQFGISGDPATNKKWTTPIKDDPVKHSNVAGTIVYATAGPNTRTTQLFINIVDNARLDKSGFAPFGTVVSGMDIVKKIYNPTPGQSGGVDQGAYEQKGQTWLKKKYPKTNSITKVTIDTSMLV